MIFDLLIPPNGPKGWDQESAVARPIYVSNSHTKGSLTVWTLYAYFSDSQNVVFDLLVVHVVSVQ